MNVRQLHQTGPQDLRLQMAAAVILFLVGVTVAGAALFRIAADHQHTAQLSAPQHDTQGSGATSAPAMPTPETRPTTPAPEPARPDAAAQKSGAPAALPPAPAEKTAPPISAK